MSYSEIQERFVGSNSMPSTVKSWTPATFTSALAELGLSFSKQVLEKLVPNLCIRQEKKSSTAAASVLLLLLTFSLKCFWFWR